MINNDSRALFNIKDLDKAVIPWWKKVLLKRRNVKRFITMDVGYEVDYTCTVSGRQYEDGTIVIDKVKYD